MHRALLPAYGLLTMLTWQSTHNIVLFIRVGRISCRPHCLFLLASEHGFLDLKSPLLLPLLVDLAQLVKALVVMEVIASLQDLRVRSGLIWTSKVFKFSKHR